MTVLRMLAVLAPLLAAGLAMPEDAAAQDLPAKRVLLVAQLAPGTGLDIIARTYAERLAQRIGQPVVVENRPGGAGVATVEAVQKAEADGTTLGVVTSSTMAIRPSMFKKPPYDPLMDFVPVSLYLKSPFILVVDPKLPLHAVPDVIAWVRSNAGKVSYSSPSVGGAPHLTAEYLKLTFGLDMTHVPYRNSPQAISDVAAGHIPLTFAEAGASLGLIRDGALRALAVTSAAPLPTLPDLPPLGKTIDRPEYEAVSWHMLVAPAGTPRPIVERLHKEMTAIISDRDMRERIAHHGLLPLDPPSIEDAQRYVASEIEKWGGLVRSLGLAGSI